MDCLSWKINLSMHGCRLLRFPICLCWIRSLLHHCRGVTVQSLHVSILALSGHVVVSMGNIILHHWCLGYHVFGQAHNDFELNSGQFSHIFPEKTDAEVFGTVFATVIAPMFGTQPREVQEGTSPRGYSAVQYLILISPVIKPPPLKF